MSNQLKFGIVGAGRIAQAYAEAFEGLEAARVVAVSDVNHEAAQALAERLHCRAYSSHTAMAQELSLDAVVVCTPPVTHRDICLELFERGIHVLCEKPLSLNSANASLMIETARRYGVTLMMASKFRYAEDVIRARSLVASGTIGEVVLLDNAFTSRVDMGSRWNSVPEISGGGVLIDNGTHSVDLMRYFLGALSEVHVVEGRRSQGLDVEETVRLCVRNDEGVLGNIDLSWSIDKQLSGFLNIYGTEGIISVGWKESRYRLTSGRDWIVFGGGYDKVQSFRSQINNFAEVILGTGEPLTTPEDAMASVQVIEAAYAGLCNCRWTKVEPSPAAVIAGRTVEFVTEADTIA
ncbi:MAG TPA: Gfo/Idh/MocA family oxidoreductase [Pyrinomonadaceae bacterium]|nr:Gfo/Idh/MocA family oxidoreductase [Pyrinomonadaceae bacterium]